jgi:hypothetical protein
MLSKRRILFSGAFHAGQCDQAREALCGYVSDGARDALYVVPNGAAKRRVIQDLVRRRGAAFGVRVVTFGGLPREIERRAHAVSASRLDPLATELLAEQATREACHSIFPPGTPIRGLARQISRTVESLEREGAAPSLLADALGDLDGRGEGTGVLLRAWERMEILREGFGRTTADALGDALALLRRDASILDGCELIVLENLPLEHALEREFVEALIAAAPGDVIAACESADHLSATPAARRSGCRPARRVWGSRSRRRTAAGSRCTASSRG